MAYLISTETGDFITKLKNTYSMTAKPRKGWIMGGGGTDNVKVCLITGGGALTGYTARAYASMMELRKDTAGTGGDAVTVFPCEIGLNSYLPEGTIVLCHETLCRVTGGTENTQPEEEEEQQGD